jgi:erythronate-4-phosphate dehydrogenase
LQNVFIATPHIAGYSLDGKANATEQVVRQVAHFFDIPELKNFKVTSLPLTTPIQVKFSKEQSFEEQLHFIFKQSYDILLDDAFLRKNPDKFEVYRKKYPVRREALAYTLHLEDALPETIEFVKFMGFNVVVEN